MSDRPRARRAWPLLIAAWAIASALPAADPTPITLPIELIGDDGFSESVSVPVADPAGIDRLWLRVHALDYPGKGSVRVGGGAWVPLRDDTVAVAEPGRSLGGIGGAATVLELSLALAPGAIVAGDNPLSFRFDRTDGVSSGFRVLAFNLFRGDAAALPASLFRDDDPAAWTVPSGSAALRGKSLYWTAPLLGSPLDPRPIRATCRDCHASDGRDLKYFAFSNRSLIARSRFHGLSEQDGRDIAAYIRLLDAPVAGRPWDPPYQPGPGIAARPVDRWSGGAGIAAVAAGDAAALATLFPGGVVDPAALATSATSTVRDTAITLPLPDWNHWLPRAAPIDLWGTAFSASDLSLIYQQLRADLAATPATAATIAGTADGFARWSTARSRFLAERIAAAPWSPEQAERIYATALWQLTKSWEVMQEFALEGYGQTVGGPAADPRAWFIDAAAAAAPDRLGIPRGAAGLGGGGVIASALSMGWLQLQTVLTPQRVGDRFVPWPALWPAFADLAAITGRPDAARLVATLTLAGQATDDGRGPDVAEGWAPDAAYDLVRLVDPRLEPLWAGCAPTLRAAIAEAMTAIWLDRTAAFTREQYLAGGHLTGDEVPVADPAGRWADRVCFAIGRLRRLGVGAATIARLVAWAQAMWPDADWAAIAYAEDGGAAGAATRAGSAGDRGCGVGGGFAALIAALAFTVSVRAPARSSRRPS